VAVLIGRGREAEARVAGGGRAWKLPGPRFVEDLVCSVAAALVPKVHGR
jgi:hypothetical protein